MKRHPQCVRHGVPCTDLLVDLSLDVRVTLPKPLTAPGAAHRDFVRGSFVPGIDR